MRATTLPKTKTSKGVSASVKIRTDLADKLSKEAKAKGKNPSQLLEEIITAKLAATPPAQFRVLLSTNEDGSTTSEISLPFPPFEGLYVELPTSGDFVKITSVFYYAEGYFDAGYDEP